MSDNQIHNMDKKMSTYHGKSRPVGSTELSWCKAVTCGTGVVVLAIQLSKQPDTALLQNALHKIQNAHPILLSKLQKNHTLTTNTFSFITSPDSHHLQLNSFDLSYTSNLLKTRSDPFNAFVSPFQHVFEHELNDNHAWTGPTRVSDLVFASVYELPGSKWAVMIRFHGAACDRTTALSVLRELMAEMDGGRTNRELEGKGEVKLGMEDLIPRGKNKKGLWAHGVDTLAYSMNSFRLTNLKFEDVKFPRSTQVVRLKMSAHDTRTLLTECKSRGIKLCGALAAAGLIAAHSKRFPNLNPKKYGVLTLTDCRSLLEPPLSANDFGYYHSTILNIHVVKGGENFWELARRSYMGFLNSKKCNKHFSDLSNLTFLMCKAIENPSLTASSSQRTSLISVFEDTVVDDCNPVQRELGLQDFMGCASMHGVGTSIAIFDTIRDGELDCTCVYPSPLHCREQMQDFVDNMKRILVDGANSEKEA